MEKQDDIRLEYAAEEQNSNEVVLHFDEIETQKILRKIDYRLVPLLALTYLVAFVDRGNIGNAKVAGMNADLNLHGMQYNVALTLFFIPYALLEVPCNIILKMSRPSIWIPSMIFAWGIVMTLTGIVQNYQGLLISRFFLGVTEAGFFPAATYLLTIWYKRYELQSRMVVFYAGASLSGAFSGLLAYGIQHMEGVANLHGWRWIFILEGIVTVLIALYMFYALPDDPATAKFLTPEERAFVQARLQDETGSGQGRVTNSDKLSMGHVLDALREWKIYLSIILYWGNSVGVYGFSYTVPSVINELGYSAANAQLMTIPIYVVAMILTVVFAILSDRYKSRSPFILLGLGLAIAGFIALIAVPHPGMPGLTYGFLFLAASGLYTMFVPTICWIGNNIAPSSKRAVGMAMLISGGNLGGIAGSNIFLERQAPHYWIGYGFCLGICVTAFVTTLILRYAFQSENKKRDEMSEEEIRSKFSESSLLQLGDKSPYFRYTL